MEHLENAKSAINYRKVGNSDLGDFFLIKGNELSVTIQDGPIGEVGINGVQVTDLLEYVLEVYKSLNKAFPCRENSLTITHIEEALHWQDARTKDRLKRQVEGLNKN